MSDVLFEMWLRANGFDQERWLPGLLRALRRRYEKSQERLVVDGECRWPTKVYRLLQQEDNV